MITTAECQSPSECKGMLGYTLDVLITIKAIVLVLLNIQGYQWFRHNRNNRYVLGVKVLLMVSSLIVSS